MSIATGASRATLGPLYAVASNALMPSPKRACSERMVLEHVCDGTPTSELGSRGTSCYAHIHFLADGQLYSSASSCPAPQHEGASALLCQFL